MIYQTIHYKKGYKYQLTRPYTIKLDIKPVAILTYPYLEMAVDGTLTTLRGYSWDGASGPTFDTKNSMRGSLVHDAGYQLIRLGVVDTSCKEYFDELFERICVEDGMNRCRAKIWKWAVMKFGQGATKPSAETREEVAP